MLHMLNMCNMLNMLNYIIKYFELTANTRPMIFAYYTTCQTFEAKKRKRKESLTYNSDTLFCDFCVFSAIHKNKLLQLKITAKHFPAKIYSGVNVLRLKFTTQKYSTKKSCLFNYNLSLSFRNKAVYNEILTHTVVLAQKICISIARTQ